MTSTVHVHTLGDSTLDNLYWMLGGNGDNLEEAKQASVEGQLQEQLGTGYKVVSHAYDGFTTRDVLGQGVVGNVLFGHDANGTITSGKLGSYVQHKYLQDCSSLTFTSRLYSISPLARLKQDVEQHPSVKHFVVLSVGGNDFREQLLNPIGLLMSVTRVQRQYLQILDKLQAMKTETKADITPILMFQYPLDVNNDVYRIYTILGIVAKSIAALQIVTVAGSAAAALLSLAGKVSKKWAAVGFVGAFMTCLLTTRAVPFKVTVDTLKGKNAALSCLGAFLEKFYKPIFERAKKDKTIILDLPNIFDPHDSSLYLSQIEPSQRGGALIGEGLAELIKNSEAGIYRKQRGTFTLQRFDRTGDYRVTLV